MSIFDVFKRNKPIQQRKLVEERAASLADVYSFSSYNGYRTSKSMKLSAVYRCVEIISDSVAQLPLEPFKIDKDGFKEKAKSHPSYYLLNKKPNNYMNRFTFIKLLVSQMLLNGNAYAYIKRDQAGNATELIPLDPQLVSIEQTPEGLLYMTPLLTTPITDEDMIHILNFTYDGINGVSTIEHASNALSLAYSGESQAQGFFTGGCNAGGYLKIDGPLSPKQKEDNKRAWQQAFSPASPEGQPGGIAVLEGNMTYNPIQISPVDSQLLESRQYSVIDICRFFGVSPVKCFDLSKSSYSTIEATQLGFLTDTLQPLLEKIELEFETKLFRPSERMKIDIRFDVSMLLRTDKTSLSNYWSRLFNMGALSPNDIRKELDLSPIEGGDNAFLNAAMRTIKNIEEGGALDNEQKQLDIDNYDIKDNQEQ